MNEERKTELLAAYKNGIRLIADELEDISDELLHYKPSSDAWSINEQVVHLCDADIISYFRFRRAVAEPGTEVQVWDQLEWQEKLAYSKSNTEECFELFKMTRLFLSDWLEQIPADQWDEANVIHAEEGKKTLEDLVIKMSDHIVFHLDLIERNIKAFSKK